MKGLRAAVAGAAVIMAASACGGLVVDTTTAADWGIERQAEGVATALSSTTTTLLGWKFGSCDDLVPDIIALSEEKATLFRPAVLKIYDPIEVARIANRLDCEGRARTEHGEQMVSFYLMEDEDGDWFIGYRGDDLLPEPTTTTEPAPFDHIHLEGIGDKRLDPIELPEGRFGADFAVSATSEAWASGSVTGDGAGNWSIWWTVSEFPGETVEAFESDGSEPLYLLVKVPSDVSWTLDITRR